VALLSPVAAADASIVTAPAVSGSAMLPLAGAALPPCRWPFLIFAASVASFA
jgi:hypothetical protein